MEHSKMIENYLSKKKLTMYMIQYTE
jgi:hypothetical protein